MIDIVQNELRPTINHARNRTEIGRFMVFVMGHYKVMPVLGLATRERFRSAGDVPEQAQADASCQDF